MGLFDKDEEKTAEELAAEADAKAAGETVTEESEPKVEGKVGTEKSAPTKKHGARKQCQGNFSYYDDNDENFPNGGNYSAEFLDSKKPENVAKRNKPRPTGTVRPQGDRIVKSVQQKEMDV